VLHSDTKKLTLIWRYRYATFRFVSENGWVPTGVPGLYFMAVVFQSLLSE